MDEQYIFSEEENLASELKAYIIRSVASRGGQTVALKPGNRVKFNWPPHPESYGYHVLPSDWTGRSNVIIEGERFEIETAKSGKSMFGRIPELWFEVRAEGEKELESKLTKGVRPLLDRQKLIAATLERPGRFNKAISSLSKLELLKLFYCPDRDVANDGRREVETHASQGDFLKPLLVILSDSIHPFRRSAQWAVLDLFEDLGSFCHTEAQSEAAIAAIKSLIWNAEDDYARTIYKAGVVLGGHLPYGKGGAALLDCLDAPSKIGRRSAIHGSYHLAEWAPENRTTITLKLCEVAAKDPEPVLREYAAAIVEDIGRGDSHHADDVSFPDEP